MAIVRYGYLDRSPLPSSAVGIRDGWLIQLRSGRKSPAPEPMIRPFSSQLKESNCGMATSTITIMIESTKPQSHYGIMLGDGGDRSSSLVLKTIQLQYAPKSFSARSARLSISALMMRGTVTSDQYVAVPPPGLNNVRRLGPTNSYGLSPLKGSCVRWWTGKNSPNRRRIIWELSSFESELALYIELEELSEEQQYYLAQHSLSPSVLKKDTGCPGFIPKITGDSDYTHGHSYMAV
ncbi:hypothetical protein BDN72DRAFT_857520 [Pluteus cervinus]|uniref:Uncharacterized protein n=1 Tax=Pluteus cervinus TaxID=181527 RepID=A0ACD3AXI8_9AGAR|nr:hypothetical protein BDN72DRAFT_857520 [Pluteus cervinus]